MIPWNSGGLQLADALLRVDGLVWLRDNKPSDFKAFAGQAALGRALAEYRDVLLAVRHAIDGELEGLPEPAVPPAVQGPAPHLLPEKAAGYITRGSGA